jgi:hypothetical protein
VTPRAAHAPHLGVDVAHPPNPPGEHCGAQLLAGLFEHRTRGGHVRGEGVQDDVAAAEAGALSSADASARDPRRPARRRTTDPATGTPAGGSYDRAGASRDWSSPGSPDTLTFTPTRRRRENRPPGSPQRAATTPCGTRHRADDRLNHQSATLHGGMPRGPERRRLSGCDGRPPPGPVAGVCQLGVGWLEVFMAWVR